MFQRCQHCFYPWYCSTEVSCVSKVIVTQALLKLSCHLIECHVIILTLCKNEQRFMHEEYNDEGHLIHV